MDATYDHVCPLDFDGLSATGTYTVAAAGAVCPPFAVGTSSALYAVLANALVFFRAQRDGSNVDASILQRRPAHRHDAHATVQRIPRPFLMLGCHRGRSRRVRSGARLLLERRRMPAGRGRSVPAVRPQPSALRGPRVVLGDVEPLLDHTALSFAATAMTAAG